MPGQPPWFKALFGFAESSSFAANRAKFRVDEGEDGQYLVCDAAPTHGQRQFIGEFSTPSLAELRQELGYEHGAHVEPHEPGSEAGGGLRFEHLPTPTGVQSLIMDPNNAGSVFQAASQFNCLEMVGPGVSPSRGVACYAQDPTQGPKCALACPAATVYRNYLCQGGMGQAKDQIDCLRDVGTVLGNDKDPTQVWRMQNGYALPVNTRTMASLGRRLGRDPGLVQAATEALRVGVHWSTSVAPKPNSEGRACSSSGKSSRSSSPPQPHRVMQVFASALPVAYAKGTKSADWEPFARLVLRASYDACLCAARVKLLLRGDGIRGRAEGEEEGRIKVFLTMLGGNAFGNRFEWIRDAITGALDAHRDAPLDVYLVHYGSTVKSMFRGIKLKSRSRSLPGAEETRMVPHQKEGEEGEGEEQQAQHPHPHPHYSKTAGMGMGIPGEEATSDADGRKGGALAAEGKE